MILYQARLAVYIFNNTDEVGNFLSWNCRFTRYSNLAGSRRLPQLSALSSACIATGLKFIIIIRVLPIPLVLFLCVFLGFFGMVSNLLTRGLQVKLAKSALAPSNIAAGLIRLDYLAKRDKENLLDFPNKHDCFSLKLRCGGAGSDMFCGIIKHWQGTIPGDVPFMSTQ